MTAVLSQETAVRLNRESAGMRVLSVYLNAEENDPADRRAWRIRLHGMLRDLEAVVLDAAEDEIPALHAATALVGRALERYNGLFPQRGWVAFASSDRLWHAGPSPAPMPDLVRWEAGAHVSPYVRAMKQSRPVTAVVADRRQARIFSYLHGELREERVIRSELASESGGAASSKHPSSHSGARGETRGDAHHRAEQAATQRMLREVVDVVAGPASRGDPMVVASSPAIASAFARALPDRARERTIDIPGLTSNSTLAEMKDAIDAAASTLSVQLQERLVEDVIETSRSAGRACLGRERTERSLEAGAVDTLVLSRALSRAEPDLAERLVDRAFGQGATVEEIAGPAAERLDREGGVGARLRFEV